MRIFSLTMLPVPHTFTIVESDNDGQNDHEFMEMWRSNCIRTVYCTLGWSGGPDEKEQELLSDC